MFISVDIHPKWKNDKQIEKVFKKYKIPVENSFVLNTASYKREVTDLLKAKLKELNVNQGDST